MYIEYWGMEGKPDYETRRQTKLALYTGNNLNLIEINNKDIEHLDDVLPAKLMRYGISSK